MPPCQADWYVLGAWARAISWFSRSDTVVAEGPKPAGGRGGPGGCLLGLLAPLDAAVPRDGGVLHRGIVTLYEGARGRSSGETHPPRIQTRGPLGVSHEWVLGSWDKNSIGISDSWQVTY